MALLRNFLHGLRGLFRKEQVEREMDEELRGYLDASVSEKMRRGMSRAEAARAARIELGGVEYVKEKVRAVSWETFVEGLWQDLRFGARLLASSPMFTAAAILSLALGIGANTAIFQLLDAIRLRALPVSNPQQIAAVRIADRNGASGDFVTRYPELTNPMWEQIRAQQQGFNGIFAWAPTTFNISPAGEVRTAQGMWVSGEFFGVLGIEPERGRLLSPADDRPGCDANAAVISHSFWQREYAGSASALGKTLILEKHPVEIVGITPVGFYGVEVGRDFDAAVPLCVEPLLRGEDSVLNRRDGWWLTVMGRLKPGWTLEKASAQLRAVSPGIFEATLPDTFGAELTKHYLGYKLGAFPGEAGFSELRQTYESPLWLLLGLAGLVLLIAAANLANLMLARASAREREMAMRVAVGATRGRLIRQLLSETLLLGGIGALGGVLVARGLTPVLVSWLSTQDDPLFLDLAMDWRMFGFTLGVTLLTCTLFGLAPALRATQVAPGLALKASGHNATSGRTRFGLRRGLVVSQIALSMMLVVGAILFARSLWRLASVDAGFTQNGVLEVDMDLTPLKLPVERRTEFKRMVLDQIRAIPGVDSAAEAQIVPLGGSYMNRQALVERGGQVMQAKTQLNIVSSGYFSALRTPLLAGRDFNDRDTPTSPKVVIVNQAFARKLFGGQNPVGAILRVKSLRDLAGPYEIVGYVKDAKYSDLREDFLPTMYTPITQEEKPDTGETILLRSNMALFSVTSAVKGKVEGVNRAIDLSFTPFRQLVEQSMLRDRLMARLSGFFGLLAALLATIGLYGVISYMVARRRNEIGIRMALGAARENIVQLVMREAAGLVGLGLLIGTALALAGGRAAATLLFGLKPWDAATFSMALSGLTLVAAAASLLPALRASRLDPMAALRDE
jgi:putative ABC transport system permease protein